MSRYRKYFSKETLHNILTTLKNALHDIVLILKEKLFTILVIIAFIVGLILLGWLLFGLILDATNTSWAFFINNIWRSWLFPDGWNLLKATPLFWIIVISTITIIAGILVNNKRSYYDTIIAPFVVTALGLSSILTIVFSFQWGAFNSEFYNKATTYVVPVDILPNTLTLIANSPKQQIPIIEGTMPNTWVPRVASATGAIHVMQKTGDIIQNTELLTPTISYIYGDTEKEGKWTAIRNGTNRQPIYGVATWSGTGEKVETCTFSGNNKLNKTFNGILGMSLNNSIADFNPNFVYQLHDVYGYCENDVPTIVIPGREVVDNENQAATTANGVITINGSPTGEPVFEYFDEIEPGQFPGPVYSKSLAKQARDGLPWSRGRVWIWEPKIGFTTSKSVSQAGNSTDLLLKNAKDDRLYWVTPLRPIAASNGETISAYQVTPADTTTKGELNETKIFTFNDNDPNVVNFNDLENAVAQAVVKADPGFFTGTNNVGRIVEFIPTSDSEWRVFAERGGRAVYQINVSGGSLMRTQIVDLMGQNDLENPDTNTGIDLDAITETSQSGEIVTNTNCGIMPSQLTDSELADCLVQLSTELANRN